MPPERQEGISQIWGAVFASKIIAFAKTNAS